MLDLMPSTYTSFKSFIFSIIYPAPKIFLRYSKNFIGIQKLVRSMPNYDQLCHPLLFDFMGNMKELDNEHDVELGMFEAILIGELDLTNNYYNLQKNYIIFVGGNTTCYQIFVPEMINLYHKNQKSLYIIGFNPPGVGMSPGVTIDLDQYSDALKSIIDNLCKHNIPATNIMTIGHSLGGGIAAKTVAQYQQQGKDIKLFVDRTMSSIGNAAGTKIRSAIPTILLRYIFGSILYLLSKMIINFLKLELDVAAHFTDINNRNPGSARGMMVHEDEIMSECGLADRLPASQLTYFRSFTLKSKYTYRRPHSMDRIELIHTDGDHAEQYFDECVSKFAKITNS